MSNDKLDYNALSKMIMIMKLSDIPKKIEEIILSLDRQLKANKTLTDKQIELLKDLYERY